MKTSKRRTAHGARGTPPIRDVRALDPALDGRLRAGRVLDSRGKSASHLICINVPAPRRGSVLL